MRASAGFHTNHAEGNWAKYFNTYSRLINFFKTALPLRSTPWTCMTFFAKSMPMIVMYFSVASSRLGRHRISALALRCRFAKGRPPHYRNWDTHSSGRYKQMNSQVNMRSAGIFDAASRVTTNIFFLGLIRSDLRIDSFKHAG